MHTRTYSRLAFTLIELLVVIAIIAILAAILFPVFARARENARKSSCLSNMKQLGLGIFQYTQDYDEKYPLGQNGGGDGQTWPIYVAPYVKSVQVFSCPSDAGANQAPAPASAAWGGTTISYASNGYYTWDNSIPGFRLYGLMGITNGSLNGSSSSLSKVNRASETVLLCEKHSQDSTWTLWGNMTTPANNSAYGPNVVLTGLGPGWNWGDQNIPDGTKTGLTYNTGANGSVSAHHLEMSNFLFADGHAKAMRPYQTNPSGDATGGQNMWDATRS